MKSVNCSKKPAEYSEEFKNFRMNQEDFELVENRIMEHQQILLKVHRTVDDESFLTEKFVKYHKENWEEFAVPVCAFDSLALVADELLWDVLPRDFTIEYHWNCKFFPNKWKTLMKKPSFYSESHDMWTLNIFVAFLLFLTRRHVFLVPFDHDATMILFLDKMEKMAVKGEWPVIN